MALALYNLEETMFPEGGGEAEGREEDKDQAQGELDAQKRLSKWANCSL